MVNNLYGCESKVHLYCHKMYVQYKLIKVWTRRHPSPFLLLCVRTYLLSAAAPGSFVLVKDYLHRDELCC